VKKHLLLRLEGPLMAFGDIAVDAHGPVADFPAASAVTGLLGNALGWRRQDPEPLERLQDRLRLAVRRDREGERLRDFQTAILGKEDEGWTTWGEPYRRGGNPETYRNPYIRHRWFDCDASLTVALRLEPAEQSPTLDDLAKALSFPSRPLFLGRKSCPPAAPLVLGLASAGSCLDALGLAPLPEGAAATPRCFWMEGEGPGTGVAMETSGRRMWRVDVHAGLQRWRAGVAMSKATS
jgi:CRISPR system Cascade subunit CasD